MFSISTLCCTFLTLTTPQLVALADLQLQQSVSDHSNHKEVSGAAICNDHLLSGWGIHFFPMQPEVQRVTDQPQTQCD